MFHSIRCLSRSGTIHNVGPILKASEIKTLLTKPTWSVQELLHSSRPVDIDSNAIKKILKLSGLNTNISQEEEAGISKALKAQMVLIQHLYEENNEIQKESSNDSNFRLLPSDHLHAEEITLEKLLKDVAEVSSQVDVEKGEKGFDTTKLTGVKNRYFTIKTKE